MARENVHENNMKPARQKTMLSGGYFGSYTRMLCILQKVDVCLKAYKLLTASDGSKSDR